MNIEDLFKNYTQQFISSQILKSPYEEIYDQIFIHNTSLYDSTLIINQGVYIPLKKYFDTILKKEYHITYIDENQLALHQLNQEIMKFQHESLSTIHIDVQIERFQSNLFQLKTNRFKDITYDTIIIHHYNYYLPQKETFFQILQSITHKDSTLLLFVTVSPNENNHYKNKIRSQIASFTNMKIGSLHSLEDVILSIPQPTFKIEHIIPYRESQYLGYGKNMIYKLIIKK